MENRLPMGSFVCSAVDGTPRTPDLCCESISVADPIAYEYAAYGVAVDTDGDFVADIIDNCPAIPNVSQADQDDDGVGDVCDDCPYTYNPDQASAVDGGVGNACNCALGDVVLGPNGCPCADGGAGSTPEAGDVCGLVIVADGGVSQRP
jgi:hypothetical protein